MPTMMSVTAQALALPKRSRALLADLLLDSLDESAQETLDREWLEVAKKRDEEIESGSVQLITHEEMMRSLREAAE